MADASTINRRALLKAAPAVGLTAALPTVALDSRSGHPAVPHGLRSTFRDWAAERTEYPRDMAEISLAHNVGSEVERAYRRGDMLEKRRAMLGGWGRFLRGEVAGNVVPITRAN